MERAWGLEMIQTLLWITNLPYISCAIFVQAHSLSFQLLMHKMRLRLFILLNFIVVYSYQNAEHTASAWYFHTLYLLPVYHLCKKVVVPVHSPLVDGFIPPSLFCALVKLNYACVPSHFSHVWLFVILRTVARQAPLSMGILQARILEWIAMPSSRRSSWLRDWTRVS